MTSPSRTEYRSPWGESSFGEREPKKSGWRWIIVILVLLLIAAGAGATYYYFYYLGQQGPNLGLEFQKPAQILVGQPFSLTVSFSNYSEGIVKDAKLSLFLPDGISFVGQPQDQRVAAQAVGDLGPGSVNQQSFNLIVTNGSQTLKHVDAKLSYTNGDTSQAQFETRARVDLLVGQPAVAFTLTTPKNVFNGSDFDMTVNYANTTNQVFKNFHLQLRYPPVFQFKKSSTAPEESSTNSWDLGELAPNASGTLVITGSVLGAENSFVNIDGLLTADFFGQTYTLSAQTASLTIAPAPLSVTLRVNNTPDFIAHLSDSLQYTMTLKNNSGITFQDVTLRAKLTGELFDFKTVQTNAVFSSIANTLYWFQGNTPWLASLAPGGENSVSWQVRLKDAYPIRLVSDKNFTLKVDATVESPTVPPGTPIEKTVSVASLETKVSGAIKVDAQAYWRDAATGILNSGPYPPRVNQPTDYTVHWRVTNYATDVASVQISAPLLSGARFTGQVKSNTTNVPLYDPTRGLVSWQIVSLPATRGVISAPAEAVFQVEVTPAVNQVNQSVQFLSDTKLQAQDTFTGANLSATAGGITTDLPDDKSITVYDRRVQP